MTLIDGARLLVVEDDPGMSALLGRLLTQDGSSVLVAADAASAAAAITSHNPDVILLDVVFAGADGFTLCQNLKRDAVTRLTPVILVTGLSDRESRIKGRQAGWGMNCAGICDPSRQCARSFGTTMSDLMDRATPTDCGETRSLCWRRSSPSSMSTTP